MTTSEPSGAIPVQARVGRTAGSVLAARQSLLDLRARRDAADRSPMRRQPRDRPIPLSFAQQRLWFLDQWTQGEPVYNAPIVLRVRGPLDLPLLGRALGHVVGRHEVLRTRYVTERGVPHQVLDPPPGTVAIPVLDLRTEPDPQVRAERARAAMTELARTRFDLARGPVLKAAAALVAEEDRLLGLCLHHIATDGWSTGILVRELVASYQAMLAGGEPELPELEVQYADFAGWQREQLTSQAVEQHLAYWRERLADLPTLDFPTDAPRPAEPSFRGATATLELPDRLRVDLAALARRERVTLLTVLLSTFVALLSRYSGQEDVVLGSIFSGRTRHELEPLIGFFANTLVLRTSTAGDPTFRELLARTNTAALGAHLHQDVSFTRLVEELRPERDTSRNPLFQVSFTLQNAVSTTGSAAGATVELEPVDPGTSRFDLAVHVTEVAGQGLELWMEYSTDLFDGARIRRLLPQFAGLLEQVVADPGRRVRTLDVVGPRERAELLAAATAPVRYERADRCLHTLVEEQVAATPDATACRFPGGQLSYAELDRRANRLARVLRAEHGVGPESVVGVLLRRGPDLPAALLGVLKAGGAYLPLDPAHPVERIAYALRDAGCRVVLTEDGLAELLPAEVAALPVDGAAARAAGDEPVPGSARPDNAAYVIYTSGSSGRPKGVLVEHRAIVNFTIGIAGVFRLGPGDRVLQFANPAFDTSGFDFYATLTSGATLVQAPDEVLYDVPALSRLMHDEAVTVTDLPPTVLAELDPAALPALRALFVGMEPFPAQLVNRWTAAGREFHNGYGPTEATVACIDYRCPAEPLTGAPPIGSPLPNYSAYVLDRFGGLVPDGVTGELHVGGAGLARGYLGRPGLTAERFVPDPFGPPGGRLYRTGDLARRQHGNLVFQGRADDQVKLRGLRVEPGEVQAALVEHPAVRQAVVVARGEGGARHLVAYVIDGTGAAGTADLRAHLAARLPAYMVPAAYVHLDAFPKNVNGKVDLARLPAPDDGPVAPAAPVPPRSETERRLAGIWADVLGVPDLGVQDDFFVLGGSSLKFTQVATRVREAFGVSVDLRTLFSSPTVEALAAAVEAEELRVAGEDEMLALLADAAER